MVVVMFLGICFVNELGGCFCFVEGVLVWEFMVLGVKKGEY